MNFPLGSMYGFYHFGDFCGYHVGKYIPLMDANCFVHPIFVKLNFFTWKHPPWFNHRIGQCGWPSHPPPCLVRRSANFQCLQDVVRLLGLDLRRPRRHRHDDSSNPTGRKGWVELPKFFVSLGLEGCKHKKTRKKILMQKIGLVSGCFFSNTNPSNRDSGAWWNAMWRLFFVCLFQPTLETRWYICHSNHSILLWFNGLVYSPVAKKATKTFKCFTSNNHIWTKVTGPSHLAKSFMGVLPYEPASCWNIWTFSHPKSWSRWSSHCLCKAWPSALSWKNEDNDFKGCLQFTGRLRWKFLGL